MKGRIAIFSDVSSSTLLQSIASLKQIVSANSVATLSRSTCRHMFTSIKDCCCPDHDSSPCAAIDKLAKLISNLFAL